METKNAFSELPFTINDTREILSHVDTETLSVIPFKKNGITVYFIPEHSDEEEFKVLKLKSWLRPKVTNPDDRISYYMIRKEDWEKVKHHKKKTIHMPEDV